MNVRWLLLSLVILFPLAPALRASLPPDQQWIRMGTDSRGTSWSMLIMRGAPGPRPAQFAGDVTVEIPLKPSVGEPRIWALDAKDRLWVFAENGRGVRYDIRSRQFEHFSIPVPQQVSDWLTVRGDRLWFAEYDPAVGSSVSSWSPGDREVKRVFVAPKAMHLEGYTFSPSTLWVAATAHGTKHPILRVAIDPDSSKILARFEATVTSDLGSGTGARLILDGDTLWITHPAAGRIDRLERSGAGRTWTIGKYAPADLVLTKGRAVVAGRQGGWEEVGPVGPNQQQWKTTSSRIFLLDPKLPNASVSAEVDASLRDAPLSTGANATVLLGQATVRLDPLPPRVEGK